MHRMKSDAILPPKTVGRRLTSASLWGGFVLLRKDPQLLHAKLTGRLTVRTLDDLQERLDAVRSAGVTTFLVLDAHHLRHIPVSVAREIAAREEGWRSQGVVAVWIGLSRYLANLLLLACSTEEQLPAFADLDSLRHQIGLLFEGSASVARGRLEMASSLSH